MFSIRDRSIHCDEESTGYGRNFLFFYHIKTAIPRQLKLLPSF